MSKESKWSKYDKDIESVITNPENKNLGYSELAREVLGKKATHKDVDVLRTYIRRNFSQYKEDNSSARLLIYDIETSRAEFRVKEFWPKEMYVSAHHMVKEPKIISISWKWFGENKVHSLTWDEDQCDKKMLEEFLKEYNSADLVIGINNNSFDNRWVNARAIKHKLEVNTLVKSHDIQKKAKKFIRIPSYSMKYMTKYFGMDNRKLEHEGLIMWEMIENGTPKQQKEYLKKMVDYNVGDILATEDLFIYFSKYLPLTIHIGVLQGEAKWTCPSSGSKDVELYKTTVTAAGTIHNIMKSNETGSLYKINNREYIKFLEYKQEE